MFGADRERLRLETRYVAGRQRLGATKDAGQRVVVAGGDRVELVVVASGAADRQSEKRPADRLKLLVDDFHPQQFLVLQFVVDRPEDEEARSGQLVGALVSIPVRHQIAGDLLDDEAVERFVVVERADDVIAVPPRVVKDSGAAPADRVGIAGHVEPVPPPPLAKMRALQQAIDPAGDDGARFRGRRVLCNELIDLFGRRRQANQIEGQTPDERLGIGIRRGLQSCLFESRQNEPIDGTFRPRRGRRSDCRRDRRAG